MASFFIVVVFLPHNYMYRCKLRSTGRLSARTRSNRRSSGEASKTMDYKSVFTNLCLELQQNRSWIKGLGKNPQKSELIHCQQCLLSGVIQRLSQPRVVCWHGFRKNSQKTECVFTRCPTGGRKRNCVYIHGLRSEGVKKRLPQRLIEMCIIPRCL